MFKELHDFSMKTTYLFNMQLIVNLKNQHNT